MLTKINSSDSDMARLSILVWLVMPESHCVKVLYAGQASFISCGF